MPGSAGAVLTDPPGPACGPHGMRFFRQSTAPCTRFPRFLLALGALALACSKRAEPPGAVSSAQPVVAQGREVGSEAEPVASVLPERKRGKAPAQPVAALGGALDNLPFDESGSDVIKIGSIAWRSWIYTDPGSNRTRYGYLRSGAIVAARGPKVVNEGCDGGWYRVNPRGFICLGLGATTELNNAVITASQGRPVRGQGLPYTYALSSDTPPFLYFRLPTAQQMQES